MGEVESGVAHWMVFDGCDCDYCMQRGIYDPFPARDDNRMFRVSTDHRMRSDTIKIGSQVVTNLKT